MTDDKEMSELFNKFFSSIFTRDEGNWEELEGLMKVREGERLDDIFISEGMVLGELLKIRENKAGGIDGIPSTLLKRCAYAIAFPYV